MIIPGMDGGATLAKMRDIDIRVKVVLSSGYGLEGQAEKIIHQGCNGFIQKHFNIMGISKIICSVLVN